MHQNEKITQLKNTIKTIRDHCRLSGNSMNEGEFPDSLQVCGSDINSTKFDSHKQGIVGTSLLQRTCPSLPQTKILKRAADREAINPSATLKKCGAKTSFEEQESNVMKTHLELLYS